VKGLDWLFRRLYAPAGVFQKRHRAVRTLAKVKNSPETGRDKLPSCSWSAAQVSGERKGCGAHLQANQELLRAALRFARVTQKRHKAVAALAEISNSRSEAAAGSVVPRVSGEECRGCGGRLQTNQELLRAALRFARVPQKVQA